MLVFHHQNAVQNLYILNRRFVCLHECLYVCMSVCLLLGSSVFFGVSSFLGPIKSKV
jgi:hypothetical protein